ncbi:MAG TPA: ABC transporter permease [Verrucomicrobiae bacterium]|jgi:putative ABC transport system permease protein|nr:ABC transporter permease [Verrucomicrobiae bacterium]
MRIFAILEIALRALRRNKMRTLLTMLGMIIGVAAVISMVGIGNGAKAQVQAQIASLGQNVILVWAGNVTRGGYHSGFGSAGTLTLEDAQAIQTEIPGITIISPEVRGYEQVAALDQDWYTTVMGESDQYFDLRQWPLIEGAPFGPHDIRAMSKVCVIGKTVARQIFGDTDPLGQIIRIRNVPFTVCGVLWPKGLSVMGSDQDDVIIMPYTSAMKRVLGANSLRAMDIQAATPALLQPVQDQIVGLLRQRHHSHNFQDDDFTVRNQQEIAEMATATATTMTYLLAAIACVSLVVGGIGIMNIMLVSVTERTREIGIRMAVGARGSDIMLQFLIEAVSLSALGGLIGIGLGVTTSKIISAQKDWPVQTPILWIVAAFFVSAAVGVFFGFYPARKASRLDPIDALRYE